MAALPLPLLLLLPPLLLWSLLSKRTLLVALEITLLQLRDTSAASICPESAVDIIGVGE